MGENSLGHGQSFVSDNRQIKRYLSRAVKTAKSDKSAINSISDFILKALSHDQKIQQNLILIVEKLIKENSIHAARAFAKSCVMAISSFPEFSNWRAKNEALYLGLAFPKASLDNDTYKKLMYFCKKLNYFNAYSNLIECLDSEEGPDQLNLFRLEIGEDANTRSSIVIEKITSKHINSQEDENIPGKSKAMFPPFVLPVVFWRHFGLLRQMISRDLRQKYHKSILGWVWAMMEPLALTLTFLLIYEIMATDPAPYRPLSIMTGILFWYFFITILKKGTTFLESNVRLIQKISLPREIFLLSVCGFALATLLLNSLSLVPFMVYYELVPTAQILLLPVVILAIAVLALGISMITSVLHAKLRDTGQVVNVTTRVGFYFTPVFYTMEMIADSRIPAEYISAYLVVNPVAVYLSVIRSMILATPLSVGFEFILIALIETFLVFIIGSYYYQAKQDMAVKYL